MFMTCAVALGADDDPASVIWTILAGQGVWGGLIFAVLGIIWKWGSPYLEEWIKARKLEKLMLAVEAGVYGTWQVYTEAIKEASKDGKLTEAEARMAREMAKTFVINFLKTQGIDVIKDYGHALLDYLIEYILGKMKLEAVVAPLSDLAPGPLPELQP